jgi:hypothetical protein
VNRACKVKSKRRSFDSGRCATFAQDDSFVGDGFLNQSENSKAGALLRPLLFAWEYDQP